VGKYDAAQVACRDGGVTPTFGFSAYKLRHHTCDVSHKEQKNSSKWCGRILSNSYPLEAEQIKLGAMSPPSLPLHCHLEDCLCSQQASDVRTQRLQGIIHLKAKVVTADRFRESFWEKGSTEVGTY
jgi:hypothetical protein